MASILLEFRFRGQALWEFKEVKVGQEGFVLALPNPCASSLCSRHGAEQYAGDLDCVFYGYHLDRAILKIADAAYCFMPSLLCSAWRNWREANILVHGLAHCDASDSLKHKHANVAFQVCSELNKILSDYLIDFLSPAAWDVDKANGLPRKGCVPFRLKMVRCLQWFTDITEVHYECNRLGKLVLCFESGVCFWGWTWSIVLPF